jgi:hypothetical protein
MAQPHYPKPLDDHVRKIVSQFDANRREAFEERAAIVQYDGHADRLQAERLACLDILANHGLPCPVRLLRVHLAQATHWVLTTDVRWASARLRAAGANLIAEHPADVTVWRQYGNLAVLGTAPW